MCCRISGTVGYPPSVVGKMVLHQKPGGPDFINWQQVSINPFNVVFGHNRLSIIDLSSSGNQPMSSDRYTITYNGEIYNYKELGSESSDTRVLLSYIGRYGIEKALNDINGMFAFGLFDSHKNEITLAVDRFGQKPIYYYHSGNKFAFASSPGALYALQDKWGLDRDALQSYWLLGSTMGDNGLFKGIKKLTGSHYLIYNLHTNQITIKKYWEPKFQENTNGIEDLVLDAIQKVKVSDVPIHIFLSGGIDSTLVASQFQGGEAIHLDGPEQSYARRASIKFNINLKVINPEFDTEDCLKDFAFQSGEPSMAALIPYVTSRETAKYGKVSISANGADELFFGYDRTTESNSIAQMKHVFRFDFLKNAGFKWDYDINNMLAKGRWFELNTYVQFDLNKTLDFASMCHGLEVRSPFLDHRLVEMALSIPEKQHRNPKNKTILKNMLRKFHFDNAFIERPKLGFSLHNKPKNMPELIKKALDFVKNEGFLVCDDRKLNARDKSYLGISALSFYYWHETWKHKIA
jgi:asparagine synthase (glutamine-hydrolysing)